MKFKKLLVIVLSTMITVCTLPIMSFDIIADAESREYRKSGYLTYYISDGKAIITDFTTPSSVIQCNNYQIPSTLDGYTVTEIAANAFYGSIIGSFHLPKSIKYIGEDAFGNCTKLVSVVIESVEAWCNIEFANQYSNPFAYASSGYVGPTNYNWTRLKHFSVPNGIKKIGNYTFYGMSCLESVTIPSSVTSIGDSAFFNCTNLKQVYISDISAWCTIDFYNSYSNPVSVNTNFYLNNSLVTNLTIPNSVTKISDYAFSNCKNLTSVTIGNNVETIGDYAFSNCKNLKNITISDSVKIIGNSILSYCSSLNNIYVNENNANYCSENGVLFSKDKKILFQYPVAKNDTTYSLPEAVLTVKSSAFNGCKSLETVSLPNGVKTIEGSAFSGCSNLSNISLPDTVELIGANAFSNTAYYNDDNNREDGALYLGNHLIDLSMSTSGDYTVKPGTISICYSAFNSCSFELRNINLPYSVKSFSPTAFQYCFSLSAINVDSNNTNFSSVDGVLFNKDRTQLIQYPLLKTDTTYIVPDTVLTILERAFSQCTPLEHIVIPGTVKTIEKSTFFNCHKLKTVIIQSGVTTIGDSTFSHCGALENISLPNSVKDIGSSVFSACYKLNSISIPNGVKELKDSTFSFCNNLANVEIPNSVLSIENNVFKGCKALTNITIPNSVISIGAFAFLDCTKLTSITIPHSTIIGVKAFSNCPNLTIYCSSGSYAETYAKSNSIKYVTENTVGNLANQETINTLVETDAMFEELAVNYPMYIENDAVNNYNGIIEKHCYEAIEDYSGFDIVRLAAMEGFFKGTEVITSELLSFLGKNSKGDQWIEDATLKLLQDVESQEMVIYDVWDAINSSYGDLDFVYGATETISKYNLAQSIAKSSKGLTGESIGKIVNEAYDNIDELGINDAFDATGKVLDIVDLTIYACQLYDAEIEIINRLLEFAPKNTTLYEGLTMIKKAREVDPAAYVISSYLKKEIASALGKLITKAGKYATSKLYNADLSITMAVVQLVMDVFYDHLYTGVKISDINKAIVLKEFHLTISSALTKKHTAILNAYNNKMVVSQSVLDDYKFLWEARTASLSTYAEACANIAKDEGRKSILESYDDEAKRLVGFDNYVKRCMTELRNAIANDTVVCTHYRNYPTRKVQSTCSSEGYTINYCLTCNEEYVSAVDAIDGHTYIKTVVNPTCENQGYTNFTCKNCRHSYNTNYTNAKGHTFTETTVKSTCLVKGYTKHTCSACGYTYKDNYQEISGHNYSGWITEYDSTCSQYGSVYNDCSICFDRIYAKITKKEHTPSNNWITSKEPTIYEEGLKQQLCSACSEVVNEETIDKLINYGDANNDGVINSLDLTNLRIALLTSDVSNLACDANEDGKINICDLIRLKKKLAGIIA